MVGRCNKYEIVKEVEDMKGIGIEEEKEHYGKLHVFVLSGLLLAFFTLPAYAKTGKDIFIENKCNKCHSIKSQGIEPTEESLKKKKKIRDLSGAGIERKSDWIKKFLKKEVANEEGEKHKEKWKGSEEDLDIISKWLEEQKTKISDEEIKSWIEELQKKVK